MSESIELKGVWSECSTAKIDLNTEKIKKFMKLQQL